MNNPLHNLNYAAPSEPGQMSPPVPPIVLLVLGAIVCLLNLIGIIAEGGEFFFAPALSLLSLLPFTAGAITSAVFLNRRRRWAGLLTLLNIVGMASSVVLGCAGVPSR